MSRPPRPEPGVEYGAAPTLEFAEARSLSAVGSLARFLGVTEHRAAELLEDPGAYVAEIRSRRPRVSAAGASSQLRRHWRPGYPDPLVG